MLFSTPQMASVHSLRERNLNINVSSNILKRVESKKLLGVHFQEHLKWNEHVNATSSSCYGTLSILRKIKHFVDYKLRKHLVEALVLSKLDYNDVVYDPIPEYLIKRLQRVQNAAASFVIGQYATLEDTIKLGWLPIDLFNNSDAILNRDALWSIQGKNHHVNAAIVRGIRRTGKILR